MLCLPYYGILDSLARICTNSRYRNGVDKRSLMENLDLTLLTLDELIDEGYVYLLDKRWANLIYATARLCHSLLCHSLLRHSLLT